MTDRGGGRVGFSGVLLQEAISGATLGTGLILCVTSLAIALLTDTSGLLPGWADPLNLSLTACLFLGPVAAGGAAVRSHLLATQGMMELAASTTRGRWGVRILTWLGFAAWSSLAYAAFVAVTLIGTDTSGPATPSMFLLPVQAVLFLLFVTGLGVAVGSIVGNPLVGPVLAVTLFVLLSYLDLSDGALGRLSLVYADTFYRYRFEPNAELLAGIVCLLGAGAIMLAVAGHRNRRLRATILAGAVVVVGLGGAAVATAPAGDVRLRAGSFGECASAQDVELCVWSGPGVPVEASLRALERTVAVAGRFFPVPHHFYEPGLNPPSDDARPFDVPPPGAPGSASHAALQAVIPQSCDKRSVQAADDLTGLVAELLNPGSVDPRGPWAAGIDAAHWRAKRQDQWVSARVEVLDTCS